MPLPDDQTKNTSIHDDTSTEAVPKPVTTTVDGSKRRLDVTSTVTGSVTLSSSIPKWDYDDTSTALTNGVDTSFFSKTTTGFIDFVQVVAKNANYEMIFIVDGVEELRIDQSQLGTIGLLSSNSTGIPIYAVSASKIFSIHPNQPHAFLTSFEIKIKATSGGNSLDGWFVSWREAQ